MFTIVPVHVTNAIKKEINRFINENNLELDDQTKENMFNDLLLAYNEYGEIATLTKGD